MCGIHRLLQGISGHHEATDPPEAGSSDMSGTGYPWPVGQLEKEGCGVRVSWGLKPRACVLVVDPSAGTQSAGGC